MATANGTHTPPAVPEPISTSTAPSTTSAASSANKRKREDDEAPNEAPARSTAPSRSQQTQRDVLELLQQHDTSPSFLEHAFDDVAAKDAPQQKKARLSDPADKTTIAAKLRSASYQSLARLKDDASRVSKAVEAEVRAKVKQEDAKGAGRLTVDELKQIQRAKGFEELVKEVADKELEYEAPTVKKEASNMANGYHGDHTPSAPSRAGTVLTLFGNAPTPKQLFSSMQNPPEGKSDPYIKTELPVEEMSLPNGLTATKIVPAPADEKKGPTFEEAFPPPYSLPTLNPPPKAHKRAPTRDTTITWEFKDPITRGSRKGGYTVQAASTGEWLGYGGLADAADAASFKERRKQRERALSSGAESMKEPASKLSPEEQQAREEEALFRRAYSSFAPSYDNSKAVIPAQTKAMLWWHKVGEQRFDETFAIDPALVDQQPDSIYDDMPPVLQDLEKDADFGRVIDELDQLDEDMSDVKQVASKTEVEQVLHEISELLETLASHQRIRNATLTSSTVTSRTPISPAPVLAARLGKPDEPAEDEVKTYHALRRELAYLILRLPPYAVAKLNGDQLADLGVSRLIRFEKKDVKGTMEEDQVARLAKHQAMATAQGIATLTRGASSSTGQHYSSTAQRTPAIGQAANTRYGTSSQYGRTPVTQPAFQRSTSNQSSAYGTPSANAPRPSYATQPNQYTRPGAPQTSYAQPNGGQYYQQQHPARTPANYAGGYNPQYAGQTPTSSANAQPRPAYTASSQPVQQFQQRAQQAAATNTSAYQANAATQPQRTASPANMQPRPIYQAPPQYNVQQQQQPGSGRATPVYPSQPATPVNGYARPSSTQPLAAAPPRVGSGTPGPNGA